MPIMHLEPTVIQCIIMENPVLEGLKMSGRDFVAIDVETANSDLASICQIGIAKFANGALVDEWSSLINPEDDFHWKNVEIHGITEDQVTGRPTFPDVMNDLGRYLNDSIGVSHMPFDRVALDRVSKKYSMPNFNTTWLDSAQVARQAWAGIKDRGYGLAEVCKIIGYEFRHHDALEDAKAAGFVLLAAIEKTNLDVTDWLAKT